MKIKNNFYYTQGLLFLILAQMMVATNIVASKFLLSTIPILALLTMRFALAALILFPLHWLTSAKLFSLRHHFAQLNKKDWVFIFIQALSAGILFNCLMLLGLQYTDANTAGIITSALPALIAIMSWVMLGEKISGKKGICVVIATLGLVIIACEQLHHVQLNHSFLGDFIVLFSLIPEASYYVFSKLHPVRLPVFLISALLNGINAIFLFFLLFFFPLYETHINGEAWLIVFILGLSSGLFYVFWYFGCQRVDGIMASLSTAVMPVATVILAGLLLNEQLTSGQFIGMSMVMASVMVYAKR
ncbi:DMT family transporter [Legionella maioricensis]|uniref:DMT family transporter n=1 Tax=Legionella maioricensis TaxID=2896528 RepID=A0A9X2D338_9GAMM|nr:DMT family transporter [Legionella maioricensis]MCL9685659.1 DMT family transporter [Legionella maioricensis]MCL9689075.1 DMT family transporter [Legionella maioricensis]